MLSSTHRATWPSTMCYPACMSAAKRSHRKMGHPPAGLRPGEKLSDYPRMTIRLPPDVRAELDAAGYVLGRPQWRVVVDALPAYAGEGQGWGGEEGRRIRARVRVGGAGATG